MSHKSILLSIIVILNIIKITIAIDNESSLKDLILEKATLPAGCTPAKGISQDACNTIIAKWTQGSCGRAPRWVIGDPVVWFDTPCENPLGGNFNDAGCHVYYDCIFYCTELCAQAPNCVWTGTANTGFCHPKPH
jgi:hypothetical protein